MALVVIESWGRLAALAVSREVALVEGLLALGGLVLLQFRLRHDEVASALRKHGIGSFHDVDYVVLETDGTFSILRRTCDRSAMAGVEGVSADRELAGRSESER